MILAAALTYIMVSFNQTSPEIAYCSAPATQAQTQGALAEFKKNRLADFLARHKGFAAPVIIDSSDSRFDRLLNGYVLNDEASNRHNVPVAPCRPFP